MTTAELGFFVPNEAERARYAQMSVSVLVPCMGYEMPVRFAACLTKLMAYSWMHGLPIYSMAYTERTVVDWARNTLSRTLLDATCEYTGRPYTHALWLDDDQVFNPDLACRLAALGHLDLVSAVYYGRVEPHYPVVYLKDDTDNPYKHWPMTECPPVVFECDAVGFGALLMRREVLEGTPEPWFTIDARGGEDIVFCRHAKAHGFKVWACGDYKIGHLSGRRPLITEADFIQYREAHPERFTDRVRVSLPIAEGG